MIINALYLYTLKLQKTEATLMILYNQEKRWIQQRLRKSHRVTAYTEPIGDATEAYSFKKAVVWIGKKLQ